MYCEKNCVEIESFKETCKQGIKKQYGKSFGSMHVIVKEIRKWDEIS